MNVIVRAIYQKVAEVTLVQTRFYDVFLFFGKQRAGSKPAVFSWQLGHFEHPLRASRNSKKRAFSSLLETMNRTKNPNWTITEFIDNDFIFVLFSYCIIKIFFNQFCYSLIQSLPINKAGLLGRIRPIFIYFFKVFHRPRGRKLNEIGCL